MKHLLFFILIVLAFHSYGQFAVVPDKDGLVNVREKGAIESKIINSLNNGHLIYCFEKNGNWINIDYTIKSKELNGYIYKDRIKLISDYNAIPIVSQTNNSVKLLKDSIEIILTQGTFDKSKHKFKYSEENNNQIELIDNKKYWGTDGEIPKTQYKKITIRLGHTAIILPGKALENLFEPNLQSIEANFDSDKKIIYIQSMNSDGAGAYEVIWKIEKGVYKERFIAYGF